MHLIRVESLAGLKNTVACGKRLIHKTSAALGRCRGQFNGLYHESVRRYALFLRRCGGALLEFVGEFE